MLKEERDSKRRLASRLKGVQLFAGLDDKNLEKIAESGREVFFETGTRILQQGEPGLAFLLILDGGVDVKRDGKSLASLGRGQFFGEMTAVDDQPRSADVVATEPTTCFGLPAWSFDAMLAGNPSVSKQVIRELVRRLRQVENSA
ncbi:MAG TPA: cyclic nucleotide-binding domain-containing protein [Candidatus Angelobacter sp.]|nr:cyclic nucleotide-binding domain-containing protein [Candidatus Angelobacter sp.]